MTAWASRHRTQNTVVKHIDDNVVCSVCASDFYDAPTLKSNPPRNPPLNIQHLMEINSSKVDENVIRKFTNDKYGVLWNGGNMVINTEHKQNKGKYLAFALFYLMMRTMYECGYQMCYGNNTHPFMDRIVGQYNPTILHEVDLSDHTFNDGTHISQYFEKLQSKRNYTDQMVDSLKKRLKKQLIVFDMAPTNEIMSKIAYNIMRKINSKL